MIRELLRRWHRLELPAALAEPELLIQAQREYGREVPESIAEWIRLVDQLDRVNLWSRVFRDAARFDRVPGHDASSVMESGEGDVRWAVEIPHLDQPDPPVRAYTLDHDSGTFVLDTAFESTTEWLLLHMLRFLELAGTGGSGLVATRRGSVEQIAAHFPHSNRLECGWILEDQDMLVFVDTKRPLSRFWASARTRVASERLRMRLEGLESI